MRIVLLILISFSLYAQTWSVVYASKKITISKSEIKNIYLKRLTQKNGVTIVALNLPSSHPARQSFMKKVLHVSSWDWDNYYDEMHFSGQKAPVVLQSPQSTVQFIHQIDGALGYIPTSLVEEGVTEVTRFEF